MRQADQKTIEQLQERVETIENLLESERARLQSVTSELGCEREARIQLDSQLKDYKTEVQT